ncbi:MAG: DUF1501 domain-containing protein [Phycisphaerales bacterium]
MSPAQHFSRRLFLKQTAGATSLLATGLTLPGFLGRTALASAADGSIDKRILVIIQMTGGNDGLNTVIPFRDDRYHRARPTLAIARDRVHDLGNDLGLHPDMSAFKGLFDDGKLSVITNVGYPNPDRSHFRSMDIWHTALTQPEKAEDGWLGRVVDRAGERQTPLALHLDDSVLPLALKTQTQSVPSIASIDSFSLAQRDPAFDTTLQAARQAATDDLLYVQRIAVSSVANARRLNDVANDNGGSAAGYPQFNLANRLRQIAQLIGADFGSRIYYTSYGGFDTHARQILSHGRLLQELSDSVVAFQRDIEARGLADRVVVMTFSEFGRRVKENGSRGTDHGAAAPMFIIGNNVRAGIIGGRPDLSDEATGDVPFTLDFRQVYASMLEDWLGTRHEAILGATFRKAAVLRV